MQMIAYNQSSIDSQRILRHLNNKYNKGVATLESSESTLTFEQKEIEAAMQCRVQSLDFIFSSHLSGIKRPLIKVMGDVELAWGSFMDNVDALDFRHKDQELPITCVHPLSDDTLKTLIDSGLYSDSDIVPLLNKLAIGDMFDVQDHMLLSVLDLRLDPSLADNGQTLPVVMSEPVHLVYDDGNVSTNTSIDMLVRKAADLVIELKRTDVNMRELLDKDNSNSNTQIVIDQVLDVSDNESTASVITELLPKVDKLVDLTEQMRNTLLVDTTDQDSRIRQLKEESKRKEYETPIIHDVDDIPVIEQEMQNTLDVEDDDLSR